MSLLRGTHLKIGLISRRILQHFIFKNFLGLWKYLIRRGVRLWSYFVTSSNWTEQVFASSSNVSTSFSTMLDPSAHRTSSTFLRRWRGKPQVVSLGSRDSGRYRAFNLLRFLSKTHGWNSQDIPFSDSLNLHVAQHIFKHERRLSLFIVICIDGQPKMKFTDKQTTVPMACWTPMPSVSLKRWRRSYEDDSGSCSPPGVSSLTTSRSSNAGRLVGTSA
jgi:hypothetical protein